MFMVNFSIPCFRPGYSIGDCQVFPAIKHAGKSIADIQALLANGYIETQLLYDTGGTDNCYIVGAVRMLIVDSASGTLYGTAVCSSRVAENNLNPEIFAVSNGTRFSAPAYTIAPTWKDVSHPKLFAYLITIGVLEVAPEWGGRIAVDTASKKAVLYDAIIRRFMVRPARQEYRGISITNNTTLDELFAVTAPLFDEAYTQAAGIETAEAEQEIKGIPFIKATPHCKDVVKVDGKVISVAGYVNTDAPEPDMYDGVDNALADIEENDPDTGISDKDAGLPYSDDDDEEDDEDDDIGLPYEDPAFCR
jgi:hypothetical protein